MERIKEEWTNKIKLGIVTIDKHRHGTFLSNNSNRHHAGIEIWTSAGPLNDDFAGCMDYIMSHASSF